jgi:hypothetical protein
VNDELGRFMKEVVMAFTEVILKHSPDGSRKMPKKKKSV